MLKIKKIKNNCVIWRTLCEREWRRACYWRS